MDDAWIKKQLEKQNTVLTEKELAQKLGLSSWTVRRMRIQEGLTHFKIGHRVFYRLESVLGWINTRESSNNSTRQESSIGMLRVIR